MSPSTSTLNPTPVRISAKYTAGPSANPGGSPANVTIKSPSVGGPKRKATWSMVTHTLPTEGVAFVWLNKANGSLNVVSIKDGAHHGRAALPVLRDAIESVYWAEKGSTSLAFSAIVFADKKTLRTAARQLTKAKDPQVNYDGFSTAGRRMDFLAHLRQGFRFITLADALAHTHHVPADPSSIDSWAGLFGVSVDAAGMSAMFGSMQGNTIPRPSDIVKNLENSERNAVSLSVFPDASSSCRCYDAAEALQSNQSALTAFDPDMLEANVASGLLTKISFLTRKHGRVAVRADSVCNLRVGSEISIIEPGSAFGQDGRISDMEFVEDVLRVTIDHPSNRALMRSSESRHVPAFMLSRPFTAQSYARSGADWVRENAGSRVADREVPFSIMLAGAPTSAT